MEDNRIHLWLDLEPNYIDSNFENVLEYLRQCDITRCCDSFYQETLELIKKRIATEVEKISNERIYNYLEMDEDHVRYRSRLLLLYLVATNAKITVNRNKYYYIYFVLYFVSLAKLFLQFFLILFMMSFAQQEFQKLE